MKRANRARVYLASGTLLLVLAGAIGPAIAVERGPVLWSSYFGGFGWEEARALAVGTDGAVYVGGSSNVADALPDAEVNSSFGELGLWDAVVVKISRDGNTLLWKAVLGGPDLDVLIGLDVDAQGIVTICGRASEGFPSTTDREHGGVQDAFVARLDPGLPVEDQLIYSTFLGGEAEEAAVDVAVSQDGLATLAGYTASRGFPVTAGVLLDAHQGGEYDLFVARLDPAAEDLDAQLVYSTYLGSRGDDIDGGPDNGPSDRTSRFHNIHMATAPDGTVIVGTGSLSPGLPTTDNAFMKNHNNSGNAAVYVARLDLGAQGLDQLVYATYLSGGTWDKPQALMVDHQGAILVLGHTYSPQFPITAGAFDRAFGGDREAFLSRLHPDLGLTYSTFLGGSGDDYGSDFVPWFEGQVLVATYTTSADFPLTAGAFQGQSGGGGDVSLTLLDLNDASDTFGRVLYSTYYGGAGLDNFRKLSGLTDGFLIGAGGSGSSDLATAGAFQPDLAGDLDMFVARLDLRIPTARFAAVPETGAAPLAVTFDASGSTTPTATTLADFSWDFGDGTTAEGQRVDHPFSEPGRYVVTLTVTNSVGHVASDTVTVTAFAPRGDLGEWHADDVGAPSFAGAARFEGEDSARLRMWSGGSSLSGRNDSLFVVHREAACDLVLTARLDEIPGGLAPGQQVGLTLRDGLDPTARHASVLLESSLGKTRLALRHRTEPGGTTTVLPQRTADRPEVTAPVWLRLERRDQVVTASWAGGIELAGDDGEATWSEVATIALDALAPEVLVGLAAAGAEPEDAETAFRPIEAVWSGLDLECLPGAPLFRRGDCNDDGEVDLSDAVCMLNWLFAAAGVPLCVAALNANGDDTVDIADAVSLLSFLFAGGIDPAAPFPDCGPATLEADEGLGCADPPHCR